MELKKGHCEKCTERNTCTQLCEIVELYVNQDFVPIEEGLVNINLENYDRYDTFGYDTWISPNFENSSILKMAIILLWKDGKSQRKIAELVPCSQPYIVKVIRRYKEDERKKS